LFDPLKLAYKAKMVLFKIAIPKDIKPLEAFALASSGNPLVMSFLNQDVMVFRLLGAGSQI
jgi:hypothetical protein